MRVLMFGLMLQEVCGHGWMELRGAKPSSQALISTVNVLGVAMMELLACSRP